MKSRSIVVTKMMPRSSRLLQANEPRNTIKLACRLTKGILNVTKT